MAPVAPVFSLRALAMAAMLAASLSSAHAAIFEDGEARRAILEMRQRVDGLQLSQQRSAEEVRKLGEENAQLRRSLLDLQTQIETLRAEQAKLNGQNEQLLRDVGELQRRQKDIAQGVDERLRQFEPIKVTVDGREFQADPAEKRDFEAALAVFRSGKFPDASAAFAAFVRQYPRSGYVPSARFWLGNAQYATREYKEAIGNFKQMLTEAPTHARAPEAALSIAIARLSSRTPALRARRWKTFCEPIRSLKRPLLPKSASQGSNDGGWCGLGLATRRRRGGGARIGASLRRASAALWSAGCSQNPCRPRCRCWYWRCRILGCGGACSQWHRSNHLDRFGPCR